jgi:hypothetical protein
MEKITLIGNRERQPNITTMLRAHKALEILVEKIAEATIIQELIVEVRTVGMERTSITHARLTVRFHGIGNDDAPAYAGSWVDFGQSVERVAEVWEREIACHATTLTKRLEDIFKAIRDVPQPHHAALP